MIRSVGVDVTNSYWGFSAVCLKEGKWNIFSSLPGQGHVSVLGIFHCWCWNCLWCQGKRQDIRRVHLSPAGNKWRGCINFSWFQLLLRQTRAKNVMVSHLKRKCWHRTLFQDYPLMSRLSLHIHGSIPSCMIWHSRTFAERIENTREFKTNKKI